MKNEAVLSGPGCSITLHNASHRNIVDVMNALPSMIAKCRRTPPIGCKERYIRAIVESELEVISGDGHDFQWDLDFESVVD